MAVECKNILGDDVWNSYYKFSFVRNPYDRCVSLWGMFKPKLSFHSFREFVESSIAHLNFEANLSSHYLVGNLTRIRHKKLKRGNKFLWHALPNHYSTYTKKGECLVDFIGKFENIDADFEYVCKQIGADIGTGLRVINRIEHKHYTELYNNPLTQDIVYTRYHKDFEIFGYDPELNGRKPNFLRYLKETRNKK